MQNKIIVANWKMNGSIDLVNNIEKALSHINYYDQIIICPPYPLINIFQKKMPTVKLGAQNCHHKKEGAYTGEVSVKILKDVGCSHVIVGHSERRNYFEETNELIKCKAQLCLEYDLIPIICIGETEEDYKSNQTIEVLQRQIAQCLPDNTSTNNVILAYEPIWAIGSGQTPTILQIKTLYNQLKKIFYGPILYGGSVNQKNGKEILSVVDGVLVGGVSLNPEEFISLLCHCD